MCVLCYSFVVVVLIVFFFKQKTAYEMRISDWSSDVCSSDLPLLATLHSPVVATPGEMRGSSWRRDRVDHAGYGIGWRIYDYAGHRVVYHEIGRASCRERVCQYV